MEGEKEREILVHYRSVTAIYHLSEQKYHFNSQASNATFPAQIFH